MIFGGHFFGFPIYFWHFKSTYKKVAIQKIFMNFFLYNLDILQQQNRKIIVLKIQKDPLTRF